MICAVALVFVSSATAQSLQSTFQGGIGIGYVDANLWVPITGPITEVRLDVAGREGSYPWRATPLSAGVDLSYLYATSIGQERYGRSVHGGLLSIGGHIGYQVNNFTGEVGVVFTSTKLSGVGPFFDPHIENAVGTKASVSYMLSDKLAVRASMTRYRTDLDGFTSEFSRHDRTWVYALTCSYRLGRL